MSRLEGGEIAAFGLFKLGDSAKRKKGSKSSLLNLWGGGEIALHFVALSRTLARTAYAVPREFKSPPSRTK